jgi:hypothetical protein
VAWIYFSLTQCLGEVKERSNDLPDVPDPSQDYTAPLQSAQAASTRPEIQTHSCYYTSVLSDRTQPVAASTAHLQPPSAGVVGPAPRHTRPRRLTISDSCARCQRKAGCVPAPACCPTDRNPGSTAARRSAPASRGDFDGARWVQHGAAGAAD